MFYPTMTNLKVVMHDEERGDERVAWEDEWVVEFGITLAAVNSTSDAHQRQIWLRIMEERRERVNFGFLSNCRPFL